MAETLRLGIIGLGSIGMQHYHNIVNHLSTQATLAAVCDSNTRRLSAVNENVHCFSSCADLLASGTIDAVILATPHFAHTTVGCQVIDSGIHLLVEKPISVHKLDCEQLIQTFQRRSRKDLMFAAMFNQRTDPRYRRIREMIRNGDLGTLKRINWVITDWFRTEHYYRSGGWRATWKGEGGGVLLNQCPHQLDLLWWLFGTPGSVWAQCRFGQWHDIEVEDDVSALLTYPNGATCSFTTSTGEAPGTNRLEVVGDLGTLITDTEGLSFIRNEEAVSVFSSTSNERFAKPETETLHMSYSDKGGQHLEVLENFCNGIVSGEPLIAPASEGIHSVEIANAMLLSTFLKQTVPLPIDGKEYWGHLEERIKGSQ